MRSTRRPLSRWEIVGAWLHVWTPPKGHDVPPVPWRKLALGSLAGLIVCGIAAALIIPPLQSGKEEGAARRARDVARAVAVETARLRADQRPHVMHVAGNHSLVIALEGAITADARARAKGGTIDGPILGTRCDASPPYLAIHPRTRVYKCFVKTSTGLQGEGHDQLGTGYPFVATIYDSRRTLVWCKQNPHADENGARGMVHVKISPACAGKLADVL